MLLKEEYFIEIRNYPDDEKFLRFDIGLHANDAQAMNAVRPLAEAFSKFRPAHISVIKAVRPTVQYERVDHWIFK